MSCYKRRIVWSMLMALFVSTYALAEDKPGDTGAVEPTDVQEEQAQTAPDGADPSEDKTDVAPPADPGRSSPDVQGSAVLEAKVAPEEEDASSGAIYQRGGLAGAGVSVGVKLGSGFSQMFSGLGASFVGELEIGYLPPLPEPIGRSFEIFLTGSYAGPTAKSTKESDPHFPGMGPGSTRSPCVS